MQKPGNLQETLTDLNTCEVLPAQLRLRGEVLRHFLLHPSNTSLNYQTPRRTEITK